MRKILLKIGPLVGCIFVGLACFYVGKQFSDDVKGIFHEVAGAFFAIPILYFSYEALLNYSQRKLNVELFEYAKLQVDSVIVNMAGQLSKLLLTYEEKSNVLNNVAFVMNQDKSQIRKKLEENWYLGFQIFKHWNVSEGKLHELLKNSFILQRLSEGQIITIIQIIDVIDRFDMIQKDVDNLFEATDRQAIGYKVVGGREINRDNVEYPERYLLMKQIEGDKFVMMDFGDFKKYQIEKATNLYRVNRHYLEMYVDAICEMVSQLNTWYDLTGKEFLIDTKQIRIRKPHKAS